MIKLLIIILGVLSIGLSYGTSNGNTKKLSQMPSNNERVTQMITSLYSPSLSPISSPSSSTTPPASNSSNSYDSSSYVYFPCPSTPSSQVFYLPSPPIPTGVSQPNPTSYLESLQSTNYSLLGKSNLYPGSAYLTPVTYDYNYPPMLYPYSYQYPRKQISYPDQPILGHQHGFHPPVIPLLPYHLPSYHSPLQSYPTPYHSVPPLNPHPLPMYPHLPIPKHSEMVPQLLYP